MPQTQEVQLERLAEALEGFIEGLITRLAVNLSARLLKDTPVDTGWARAHWVPNIGEPTDTNPGESGDVAAAEGVRTQALTQVLEYKLERGNVLVSNHVPYIVQLNAGSSRQAPPMFVERAIVQEIEQEARPVR